MEYQETEQYKRMQEWGASVNRQIDELYPESAGFDPMSTANQDEAHLSAYREIAAATKRICSGDGYGHQVVVWADLSWSEAVDANSEIGRGVSGTDAIERPITRFCTPLSMADVRDLLAN